VPFSFIKGKNKMKNKIKYLRILAVALILTLIVIPIGASNVYALTPTLQENLVTGGDAASATHIYGANFVAQQFTSLADAHTVTSIGVGIYRSGSPGTVTVSLYNAAAGVPTTLITSTTLNGNALAVAYSGVIKVNLTVEYQSMLASTQYAIVVSAPNGDAGNYVLWWSDSGGGLANAVGSNSTDGGSSWTSDTPVDYLFSVYGNTVLSIVSAGVSQSYLTSGDLLFYIELINIYPPYANVYDPAQYFQIQLIGLDTTTVLAATPMTAWGDRPESIYLSASSASSITVGAAYIIKVVGTWTATPPSITYTLQPSDWKGSNLTYLDKWMINTAYSISLYENFANGTLTQYVTDQGEILTDAGGALFTNAIPGIAQIRPNKFAVAKSKPQFALGTNQGTYDASKLYSTQLGTEISDDLDTWGALFSISGSTFGGLLIGLLVAILLFAGMILGGRAAMPVFVIICLPILFIGNYTGLVSIQWTLGLGAIAFILFVRQLWWKTT